MLALCFRRLSLISLLVILVSFLLHLVIEYLISRNSELSKKDSQCNYYSSGWCLGSDNTNRRCRFNNICYKKDTKDFVFFHHYEHSVAYGIPESRFNPSLADLSSVENHNQYYFNYVATPCTSFLNLSEGRKVRHVPEATLISGRFKPDNLMHLFHDDLLPLFRTIKQLTLEDSKYNFLFLDIWPPIDDPSLRFNRELYGKLLKPRHVFYEDQFDDSQLVCFSEVLVGLSHETLWYDYGFRHPQGPLYRVHDQTLALRKVVTQISQKLTGSDPSTLRCESSHAILVSRQSTRLVLNEEEVVGVIGEVTGLPVIRMRVEQFLHVSETVSRIKCAKLMVGMHGSALTLAMFLPLGASLVEMFPYAIDPTNYTPYKTLANSLGLLYKTWTNNNPNNSFPHPEHTPSLGGIHHLPLHQQREITESPSVPSHLCCSHPGWLYRIYQDTIVDTKSFRETLVDAVLQINSSGKNNEGSKAFPETGLNPGPVRKVTCNIKPDTGVYDLTWVEPWNLQYMTARSVKYEIMVHEQDKTTGNIYFSKSNHYKLITSGKSPLVWIRCHLNAKKGPFPVEPCYC